MRGSKRVTESGGELKTHAHCSTRASRNNLSPKRNVEGKPSKHEVGGKTHAHSSTRASRNNICPKRNVEGKPSKREIGGKTYVQTQPYRRNKSQREGEREGEGAYLD
jgi:hypothetical protein